MWESRWEWTRQEGRVGKEIKMVLLASIDRLPGTDTVYVMAPKLGF